MYKNSIGLSTLAFWLLMLVLCQTTFPNDWPFWRGPNRNGISGEKGWNPESLDGGASILWKIKVGEGYSSIAVSKGFLYTLANTEGKDILYCLEEKTGREVWRFSYECPIRAYPGSFSTPVVDGMWVYTFSRNGDVHCNHSRTGKERWSVNVVAEYGAEKPKYGFSGSPVIEGNTVLLNAGLYGIALDKHSGGKVWASPPGRAGYASPVLYTFGGKRCVIMFAHRHLNAVDVDSGERLWHFPWVFDDGADSPDPVVVGDRVFISTAYRNGGTMIEFTGNRPHQRWFKKEIQNEFGSSIYLDGYLYVPDGDTRHRTAYLKCIDFETGEEVWRRDTGHCSIILVDGKFILLNQWGELIIMEASEKGFKDFSRARVVETSGRVRCWTAPVLANSRIYVRTNAGDIVCVDVSF